MASLLQRNKTWYLQDRFNGKIKRVSLRTTSRQLAQEKLRQYESAQFRGTDNPLPTRTPIADVVTAYVEHIRLHKTPKSAQTDVYYLREAFGPICDALRINSRRTSERTRKRKIIPGSDMKVDGRCKPHVIEAKCFEQISTANVQTFIDRLVRARGLAPKTANRYREILHRLFAWALKTKLIRTPGSVNPVKDVERYRERAGEIRFLTLPQVEEQLHALRFNPHLQTMVAVLIYAGLRREELLWLTLDDIDLRPTSHGGHGMIRIRAKTIAGQYWQPKTKSNRAAPISSTLRAYLDRYTPPATVSPTQAEWETFRASGGGATSGGGCFFPSPQGAWWDPDNFSGRHLRKANSAAGLKWTCLDFRHTFGSQLAQNGVSLYKIATLMGNSPEICRRHYASLIPEAMGAEVEFYGTRQSVGLRVDEKAS